MKKRLSVLLPNYNNAPYLKECLETIVAQTFTDFQVIFVDDCSTDNSVKIIKEYGDERFVVIKKKKNSGIVETMNKGLAAIDTEYYIRLDGDDRMRQDRFELLVKYMDENPNIDVCGSSIQTFGIREELQQYPQNSNLNKANLIFGHSIGHASCIFRTNTIKKNQIQYQNDYYRLEDYQLFYTIKDIAKTTSLREPLYYYRQEAYNNDSSTEAKKNLAYHSFYEMILNDLGMLFNSKSLDIHMQLANKSELKYGLKAVDAHIKSLIDANKDKKLFPENELIEVLRNRRLKLLYKFIDLGEMTRSELLKEGVKHPALLRYFVAKQFKKNR